jgi:hypothetical protein
MALLIVDDYLFSGGRDSIIKKWEISTGELLWSAEYEGVTRKLIQTGSILYSGSVSHSYIRLDSEIGLLLQKVTGMIDFLVINIRPFFLSMEHLCFWKLFICRIHRFKHSCVENFQRRYTDDSIWACVCYKLLVAFFKWPVLGL